MPNRPKVGEILLRAGLIDEFQLNSALGEQARWGRPLGATLVKLGFVEEKDLTRALASQLGLPIASLEGKHIHPDVLALVPLEIAERHMVVPLFTKEQGGREELYVGIEDPGDLSVLDDLAFRTGMDIRPVMVCPSELWEGIDRYYRRPALDSDSLRSVDGRPESPAPSPASSEPAAPSQVSPGTEELARHWMGGADAATESTPVEAPEATPTATPSEAPAAPERAQPAPVQQPPAQAAGTARAPTPAPGAGDEKTRTILHALTQLLVEKGVITRAELHERVRQLTESGAAVSWNSKLCSACSS